MQFLYGIDGNYVDVTYKVFKTCYNQGIFYIPIDDNERAYLFGDHLYGVKKELLCNGTPCRVREIMTMEDQNWNPTRPTLDFRNKEGKEKLEMIHRHVLFFGGRVRDEYPEQLLAVRYIQENDVVLELGANIGRNTLTISSLLSDSRNLVTLETDPSTCKVLQYNRDMNDFSFHIENSALSKRPLVQQGWETKPSDGNNADADGAQAKGVAVNTISWTQLQEKYKLAFSVLVADCEGALYYILQDEPNLLDKMRLVIMENDYHDINHKVFVDKVMMEKGFRCIHNEMGGWGCCKEFFFQAWSK